MRQAFFQYQAQTSPDPLGLEISHARGSEVFSADGRRYLDLIAGVSALPLGHAHPAVVQAIKDQADKYLHVMVYGEFVQGPPVALCQLLAAQLPGALGKTYLTNSGTEAIEGALKLARRFTGRSQILAAKDAYHGNTMGSLSLMTLEQRQKPFRPLIGAVSHIRFNAVEDLEQITTDTAAVILETIQGGAGFILPERDYLQAVKRRCEEMGSLLILDEIQPGFGRTGRLFGFEHFGVIPDIVVMGKGMGGGMPIGAFTSAPAIMDSLSDRPKMGHITTFGGNPVIAASALATLKVLTESQVINQVAEKERLFRELLVHPLINQVRGKGLMLALLLNSPEVADQLVLRAKDRGLLLFWLLFEKRAVRVTPPLIITEQEIREACGIIIAVLDELV